MIFTKMTKSQTIKPIMKSVYCDKWSMEGRKLGILTWRGFDCDQEGS